MKILTHLAVAIIVAGAILYIINKKVVTLTHDKTIVELVNMNSVVEKTIDNLSNQLLGQISAFCSTVVDDRDFAMNLLVEQDYASSEIADITGRYMNAMGFSFLEIVDSNYTILSSGHFPASIGSNASNKKELLDQRVTCLSDDIKGAKVLSLQAKKSFSCAGVKLHCIGGIKVDDQFISHLKPNDNIQILLKDKNTILGMDNIQTISDITENTIIINDKTWLATTMALTWSGDGKGPEIVILMDKPEKVTMLDLLL